MKHTGYILVLAGLALFSCTEQVDFDLEYKPKIDLISEISPNSDVVVHALTTGGLEEGQPVDYPEMEINFYVDGLPSAVRRQELMGEGVYLNNQIQLEVGKEYRIEASVIGNENVEMITASTIIPEPSQIDPTSFIFHSNPSSVPGTETENFAKRTVTVGFQMDKDELSTAYFHIEPYMVGGNHEKTAINISQLVEGSNAAMLLEHKEGLLLDASKLDDDLILELTTKDVIDTNQVDLDEIHMVVKTVSNAYYNYHKKISTQIRSSVTPVINPVINFTNIQEGYGLFSGYSSVAQDFSL